MVFRYAPVVVSTETEIRISIIDYPELNFRQNPIAGNPIPGEPVFYPRQPRAGAYESANSAVNSISHPGWNPRYSHERGITPDPPHRVL